MLYRVCCRVCAECALSHSRPLLVAGALHMGLSLADLFVAGLLVLNGAAVLSEERVLVPEALFGLRGGRGSRAAEMAKRVQPQAAGAER